MKIKSIIAGIVAVVIIGGVLVSKLSTQEQVYTPRYDEANALSSPKGAAEYLNLLRANQITGEIDVNDYYGVRKQVQSVNRRSNKSVLGFSWEHMGPDNVGGRTRAILIDKNNPNLLYAGGVSGGLFISNNKGATWTPVADHNLGDNLSISCIAQTSDGRIFFGTGASFESSDGAGGSGSIGGGLYEYLVTSGTIVPIIQTGVTPNNSSFDTWTYINEIATFGNRIYLATGKGLKWAEPVAGVYPSSSSGWTNPVRLVPGGAFHAGLCKDVDVASDGTVLTSFPNQVWISPNGADNSFVKSTLIGSRLDCAIAPSNTNVMYAAGTIGCLSKIYISENKGVTWSVIAEGGGSFAPYSYSGANCQGEYDMAIAVNPSNPYNILLGGIHLWSWTKTQSSPIFGDWTEVAHITPYLGTPSYVHADKHEILWPTAGTIYIGCDGGIFRSLDGGGTWTENNYNYDVTQFYSVATSAKGYIMGGTQDNGTLLHSFNEVDPGPTPLAASQVQGGDGFDCAFSNFTSKGIAFTSSQNGQLKRAEIGASPGSFWDAELDGMCGLIPGGNNCGSFYSSFSYWEELSDSNTIDSVMFMVDSLTTFNIGDTMFYVSSTNDIALYKVLTALTVVDTADTLMLPDYVQSKLVFASPTPNTIYMTRDAPKINTSLIRWNQIAGATSLPSVYSGTALSMEFSSDGSYLFAGTSTGKVYRFDSLSVAGNAYTLDSLNSLDSLNRMDSITLYSYGLGNVCVGEFDINPGLDTVACLRTMVDTLRVLDSIRDYIVFIDILDSLNNDVRASGVMRCTQIADFSGRAVTGIAVDPNNADNIIVTLGNYGNSTYIYRTNFATTAPIDVGTANFTAIQGPIAPSALGYLPRMPIYDAVIDFNNDDLVVIGTEWGVWASSNAFTGGSTTVEWYDESTNGMAHVPVHEVIQQTLPNWMSANTQQYYLGTHGRGFYKSSTLVVITGVDDNKDLVDDKPVNNLNVYPNPVSGNNGVLAFNLIENSATTKIKIYSITGRLVDQVDLGKMDRGNHKVRFESSSLETGTYIISLEADSYREVTKFVVTN